MCLTMKVSERIFNNSEFTLLRPFEVGTYFSEPWFEDEAVPVEMETSNGQSTTVYFVPSWRILGGSVDRLFDELKGLKHE